jgi:spermidine/putrescine transport system substrate-binding protein
VTITDYDSNDTALAKVRQGGTGFDIVVPSQSHLPIWISEGLLLETDPGKMENAKNMAPEWADPEFDKGRKYSVPWQWGTVGVSVNTDSLQGRHQHLGHHLRYACRAQGQGQCRA